jgi:hypothetical protein
MSEGRSTGTCIASIPPRSAPTSTPLAGKRGRSRLGPQPRRGWHQTPRPDRSNGQADHLDGDGWTGRGTGAGAILARSGPDRTAAQTKAGGSRQRLYRATGARPVAAAQDRGGDSAVLDRTPTRRAVRPGGLQTPQRGRTQHQPAQAISRDRDPLRQTCLDVPRRYHRGGPCPILALTGFANTP